MGPGRVWQYHVVCPIRWDQGGYGNISLCVLLDGTREGMAISVCVLLGGTWGGYGNISLCIIRWDWGGYSNTF